MLLPMEEAWLKSLSSHQEASTGLGTRGLGEVGDEVHFCVEIYCSNVGAHPDQINGLPCNVYVGLPI